MKFSKILLTTGLGVVIFTFNVQAVTPCGLELVNGAWKKTKDGPWCPPNFNCSDTAIGIDGCTTDIATVQGQGLPESSCGICIS